MLNLEHFCALPYVGRIAQILVQRDKYPQLNTRGFIDILDVAYRKYQTQLSTKFSWSEAFVGRLQDIVFVPITGGEGKQIVPDQALFLSALNLLERICVTTPKYTQPIIAKLYPLLKYFCSAYLQNRLLAHQRSRRLEHLCGG